MTTLVTMDVTNKGIIKFIKEYFFLSVCFSLCLSVCLLSVFGSLSVSLFVFVSLSLTLIPPTFSPQLESKLKEKVDQSLANQVDLGQEQEMFRNLASSSIQLLVQDSESACVSAFNAMVKVVTAS